MNKEGISSAALHRDGVHREWWRGVPRGRQTPGRLSSSWGRLVCGTGNGSGQSILGVGFREECSQP